MVGKNIAEQFGVKLGNIVQEFGYDDDVDEALREHIEQLTGEPFEDEDYRGIADVVLAKAAEVSPDAILCIGQAGGRGAITPELVAINLRYAKIPDTKGNSPKDEPILTDGSVAYFSTLPARQMAEAINTAGVASQLSYSAGAYVCNDLFYTLLHRYQNTATRVGFIHIPYATEQGKEPAMEMEDMIKGLTLAIENMEIKNENE